MTLSSRTHISLDQAAHKHFVGNRERGSGDRIAPVRQEARADLGGAHRGLSLPPNASGPLSRFPVRFGGPEAAPGDGS